MMRLRTTDDKNMAGIRNSLEKLVDKDKDLEKKVEHTAKLKKIAGDDLEKLESVIQAKGKAGEWFSKIIWAILLAVLGGLGKALWDAINHK
jgi:cytoskeletal protein RodZ